MRDHPSSGSGVGCGGGDGTSVDSNLPDSDFSRGCSWRGSATGSDLPDSGCVSRGLPSHDAFRGDSAGDVGSCGGGKLDTDSGFGNSILLRAHVLPVIKEVDDTNAGVGGAGGCA